MAVNHYAVVFVLFVSLSSLAVAVPTSGHGVRFYEQARNFYDAGDYQAALPLLHRTLEDNPGDLPSKVLLGRVRLGLGHAKAAEQIFEEARQLGAAGSLVASPLAAARNQLGLYQRNVDSIGPGDLSADSGGDLWVELGKAYLALGRLIDAKFAFDQAVKRQPGHVGARLGQVSVHLEEGRLGQAEAMCRSVLDESSQSADAWYIMGTLLERRGLLGEAETHFDKALAVDVNHRKAQLAQAIVVLNRNRPDEAVALLDAVIAHRPYSLEALYLRSQALAAAGRPQDAQGALDRAAEMVSGVTPDDLLGNPRLLLISSLVLYDTDQLAQSADFLQRYLAIMPGDLQARKQSAKIATLSGKPLDAIRELRSIALANPRDAQVLVMLGDVFAELKDYLTAEKYYRDAIEQSVPDLRLIGRLGFAQYGRGRADLAMETMQRLVELAPGRSTGASIFLGILYLHFGDTEAAGKIADDIVAQVPDHLLAINLQGVVAVAEKRYADGRQFFAMALERDSNFDPARINLIKLDIIDDDYEAATASLERLIGAEPHNVGALRTYAELQLAQREYRAAAGHLETILAIQPRSVGDAMLLSRILQVLGERDDALTVLNTIAKLVPDSAALKRRMAEIHVARGDTDAARSLLVDAAQLAGAHAVERVAVAELQFKVGAYDDVLQGMQRVLSEFPEAVQPQLLKAQVHQRRGNLIRADDIVSRVLVDHPDEVQALTLLARIRAGRGQNDEAIALFLRAAELDDSAASAVGLYKIRNATGRTAEALHELAEWNAANPDNERVLGVLADHYLRDGNSARAIELYRRITEINPGNALAHNNLAVALFDIDGEQALAAAERAYELASDNAAILDTVGWIQVQLGDLENGLSRLREALVRNDKVPDIRYHLGVALEEFGSRASAIKELRRALASDAPFAGRKDAEMRLQRLEREQ